MSAAVPVPQDLLEHAAFLRRLARSLLADGHAADDVVQETWTRTLERPPARGGDLHDWLARVARNFALRRRREEARRGQRERDSARSEALPPPEATLERGETLQRVVDAVRALEEPYRAAILARFYEDLPPRAIAARDGVSVETVNTRLKRGLARLRERLERGPRDWRPALGLLAGQSPCLPSAGGSVVVTLMQIKTLAAVGAALVLGWGLWRVLDLDGSRSAPTDDSRTAMRETDAAAPAALALDPARRSALPATPVELALSGRVLDERGAPVPEARLHVLGPEDPFAAEHDAPAIGWNAYRGHTFACDAEGRWRAVLPREMRLLVVLEETEALVLAPGATSERWVDVPATGVDFVVRRMPTARIEVRVVEGAGRVPLEAFRVSLHHSVPSEDGGADYRFFRSQGTSDSVLRTEVRIDDPAGLGVRVILSEPSVGNLWSKLLGEPEFLHQEIHLDAGEIEHVLFVLPERDLLRGQVVDPDGAPVAGAFVYFGSQARARGDEPFQPFRPERVVDGVRTGADGWFELRGAGSEVTAGHEGFTSVTVGARSASRIQLGARATLRGRLVDVAGRALAGAGLRLDSRGPEATTDADGRFAFEEVEAGAHGVFLVGEDDGGQVLACVRLASGEEAEVELGLPGEHGLELVLRADGLPALDGLRGLIVGRERVSSLQEVVPGQTPGTLSVPASVLPGRYWLATSLGISAPFTLEPGVERLELELGRAELRVRSAALATVQAVPADSDPFLGLVAARAYVKIAPGGEAGFRLAPGRYRIVGQAGVVLREVELPAEGTLVELD